MSSFSINTGQPVNPYRCNKKHSHIKYNVNLYFKQKKYIHFLLKAPARHVISELASFKGEL
ncbi:hypothetical protein ACSO1_20770 [Acinetobacter calcoaceticus]|nr:hypothetical protein ACSO1_20770 [Acinetobacter calcoaceticus]